MRVSYDGKILDFQTGIVLNKNNWDDAQQRVILFNSSAALANDLNDKLSLMLVNMVSIFRDFELKNVMPTTAELRYAYKYQNTPKPQTVAAAPKKDRIITVQQVDNKEEKPKNKSLWKSFDEFVKVNGKLNDWTPATHENSL